MESKQPTQTTARPAGDGRSADQRAQPRRPRRAPHGRPASAPNVPTPQHKNCGAHPPRRRLTMGRTGKRYSKAARRARASRKPQERRTRPAGAERSECSSAGGNPPRPSPGGAEPAKRRFGWGARTRSGACGATNDERGWGGEARLTGAGGYMLGSKKPSLPLHGHGRA